MVNGERQGPELPLNCHQSCIKKVYFHKIGDFNVLNLFIFKILLKYFLSLILALKGNDSFRKRFFEIESFEVIVETTWAFLAIFETFLAEEYKTEKLSELFQNIYWFRFASIRVTISQIFL
jgi:hypothetical protein